MSAELAAAAIVKELAVEVGAVTLESILHVLGERRVHQATKLIGQLEKKINRVERKFDAEAFGALVNRAVLASMTDTRDFKVALFVSVLAGVYVEDEKAVPGALFLSLVERFEPYHIAILRDMLLVDGTDRGHDNTKPPAFGFQYIVDIVIKSAGFEGALATDVATAALNELMSAGLLHTRLGKQKSGGLMTGINPVGLLRIQAFRLSPLGEQFVNYVVDQAT